MARLLIIGALTAELGLAARMATARGARLAQAEGVASGLERLRAVGADLVLCEVTHDIGWLVEQLAAERIACPVVACGRNADAAAAVRAIRAGAKEFLPLPPDAELIAAMLAAAAGEADAPVHRDPAMAALLDRAAQLATAQASILITGESGTGKEVLARHIHRSSRRMQGPFVALNCAALPEALLESELFGHEKGAFSGAVAARRGKFEQADGGTLLLDEIGEMDPRLQAKILRVIQEREVDRLGGGAPIKVDVRLLAATNRDLAAEVQAGRFRADLYYRLNVLALHIPPLRERPLDILALAGHFAIRYAEANGLPKRALSPAAEALLLSHPWPGNVRELENTLHRAVLLARGPAIGPEAVELTLLAPLPQAEPRPAARAEPAASRSLSGLVGRKVEEVERDLILETLSHCLGNRTRAAEILGISIRTLRNKLHEYRAQGMPVPAAHPPLPWPMEA
ncbi:sigma-54 interaction domain-containing protein [Belnapia rosea]|uniref:DNA-binding transcriptional response regulator, NtrC family, contains REC, AAA-type ATPase, and a Fis-type DNA-binding domains n=1 Tax=Belnapia rosea TaxID=938405 RepID=A0A1G6VL90_9PROT|nr:sigma-54 dependent transcriptional regulator [Belnapia rosea]SDB37137.1 DNA-binding transcriptional response regulator, NtrC family, contains REC, AAA-type ATPase, and a Fis-type DNA-binding domains [Belnapia rosea]SDD54328.1 DNA-binding transcriptional response regulator, NtrC family, contains REC, AAA-type ATPase, and a Fis-type DNA-binding domains [Belnapia rosea]